MPKGTKCAAVVLLSLLSTGCASSPPAAAPTAAVPEPPQPAAVVPPPAPVAPPPAPVEPYPTIPSYTATPNNTTGTPTKTSFRIYDAEAKRCPDCTVVNVFYATNRGLTGDYSRGSKIFGSIPSRVRYGVAQVSIPPWGTHRVGGLEQPRYVKLQVKWDPNKHVMLLNVGLDAEARWRERVTRAVSRSSGDALVFIHGFNVRFVDAARRTAQMSHDLQFRGVPVMYTWPSRGELSEAAYRADQKAADASVDHLKRFLMSLAATPGIKSIHIIAHSMGNRLLAQTLAAISVDAAVNPKPRFNQIALTAPDIDAPVMARLAQAITPLAHRVTLYASSKDLALKFAVKVNKAPRAGLGGSNILLLPGIDSVDASAVDTNLIGHFYYAENRSVLNDIFYVIRGTPSEPPRFGMKRVRNGTKQFWRFLP